MWITLQQGERRVRVLLEPGDHLEIYRGPHWHHGIYDGAGFVIDVHKPGDGSPTTVRRTTFRGFVGNSTQLRVHSHADGLPRVLVVGRARWWVGKTFHYDVASQNCEHFANWCATNTAKSGQIRSVVAGLLLLVGAAVAARKDAA